MATTFGFRGAMTETISAEPTLQMRLQIPQPPKNAAPSTRLRNRLRLDPSRALEPARKKIATIEAQRVMSVFETTIENSEIVTLLPFLLQSLDRFRVVLGTELSDLLQQHAMTLESYEEIKEALDNQMKRSRIRSASSTQSAHSVRSPLGDEDQQEGLPQERDEEEGNQMLEEEEADTEGNQMLEEEEGSARGSPHSSMRSQSRASSAASAKSAMSIDSQIERTMHSLTLVAQQLSTSCKNLLRGFARNPAAAVAIKKEALKREHISQELVICMNELKDILLNKLLTTPEEEKERMEYIQEISKRERTNAAVIEKLETELKAAQDDKDEEIRKKNDVIRKLQADLHQIEKFSEDHNRRVRTEAEKQEAADIKNCEGRKQRLQQEENQLKTSLQNLVLEHREKEQDLRTKKFKIETTVENWIQKFDKDMGERQDEYEEIDAVYTEEKKQLHELEERFKTLEEEYQQIMEERRLAREKREAAEREMALMIKGATTIQAFWRSYKVRKALKARKKKGGGKKKK